MRPYEVEETPDGLYAADLEIDFPVPKDGFAISPVHFNRRLPHPLTAQVEVLREDLPYTVWITCCPVGPRRSVHVDLDPDRGRPAPPRSTGRSRTACWPRTSPS